MILLEQLCESFIEEIIVSGGPKTVNQENCFKTVNNNDIALRLDEYMKCQTNIAKSYSKIVYSNGHNNGFP